MLARCVSLVPDDGCAGMLHIRSYRRHVERDCFCYLEMLFASRSTGLSQPAALGICACSLSFDSETLFSVVTAPISSGIS